jgi:Fe-S-cluster-containing dehydrogenase component
MSDAFLLDLTQCIGCNGCTVACKTGNELGEGTSFIQIGERISGTFPDLVGRRQQPPLLPLR